jgi:hypothetical protein
MILSTRFIVLLSILAAVCCTDTSIFQARAAAWKTCIRNLTDFKPTRSTRAALCIVPNANVTNPSFAHVHVYKNAGTALNNLVEAACQVRQGHYRMLRNQQTLEQTVRRMGDRLMLFSAQRNPIDRFYSVVAEAARRGTFIFPVLKQAELLQNPKATLNWTLHTQTRERLVSREVHFSEQLEFLIRYGNQAPLPLHPWPLRYMIDMRRPTEVKAIWAILMGGRLDPFPDLHGRHHQDEEYEQCLDETHVECQHVTDRTRQLVKWLVMETRDSTAEMNQTILSKWYPEDTRCYASAEQAVAATMVS